MEKIVAAVRELSLARSSEEIRAIVDAAARTMTKLEGLALVEAFAESASRALAQAARADSLEKRLEETAAELKSFSSAVSHDLRAPVRSMMGFVTALEEDAGDALPVDARKHIVRVKNAAGRMNELIDAMLGLSQVTNAQITLRAIDVSAMAGEIVAELRTANRGRAVTAVIQPGIQTKGDVRLVRILLTSLLSNAWKFTGKKSGPATIEIGQLDGEIFVKDDGAGFDLAYVHKLFAPFQRLVTPSEFPGAGVGLAMAARVVRRHGGSIRAEGRVNEGATFTFKLEP